MGDFNCNSGSVPYKILTEGNETLKDAEYISENGNYVLILVITNGGK